MKLIFLVTNYYCHAYRVCVTYRLVWIGWLDLLTPYTQHSELQAITALPLISALYSSQLQSTLGFSVFNSRFLAMDLLQSHCNFNSHMKYSLHSLIPFLPPHSILCCNCRLRKWFNSTTNCVRCSLYSLGADPQKTPLTLLLRVYSLLQRCVYRTVT
jgi:hypothetical protein